MLKYRYHLINLVPLFFMQKFPQFTVTGCTTSVVANVDLPNLLSFATFHIICCKPFGKDRKFYFSFPKQQQKLIKPFIPFCNIHVAF